MGAVHRKPADESLFDEVEQDLEQISAHSREHADDHGQKHHDLLVGESPGQPEEFAVEWSARKDIFLLVVSEMLGLSGDQLLVVEVVDLHGCTNVRQGFGSRGAGRFSEPLRRISYTSPMRPS